MGTFTNSEEADEMTHDAAFHLGLHCLNRLKRSSDNKIQSLFFKYNLTSLGYVQWAIPSLLYQTRRNNIYKYTKGKRINNLEFQIKKNNE